MPDAPGTEGHRPLGYPGQPRPIVPFQEPGEAKDMPYYMLSGSGRLYQGWAVGSSRKPRSAAY
jgi:hypothetical protein